MVEHDGHVGLLLKALDDLNIANDTIVIYTTDNGPHENSWPDGANSPFRSEKTTNWEGGYRVPCMMRWPGRVAPGSVSNEIISPLDWFPTLVAAAGETDIKGKLLTGYNAGANTFKVHLDGYNQLPHLTGQQERGARKEFIYFNDDGDLVALRSRTGSLCSRSSEPRAPCWSGRSHSQSSGCPRCLICGPTPTSAPTSPRTPTTMGALTGIRDRCGSSRGRQLLVVVQGLSAESACAELQHRSDRREDAKQPSAAALGMRGRAGGAKAATNALRSLGGRHE
jgi:hypothetical protein